MFGTDFFGFQIIFKCMSGSTTENGKFIVPLTEKLTYPKSSDRCDSQGLTRFLLPIMVYLQPSELELNQMEHLRWWSIINPNGKTGTSDSPSSNRF